jgi:transcriptional regulator with XRE-family HTH domain
MANERLRALLLERRVTTAKLAEAVQVDAKTVERWILAGRVPYRKHRYNVAAFFGVDEAYIWPDALDHDQVRSASESEIVAVYPYRRAMPDKVRSALAMFRTLEPVPNVEIRLHGTILYNSIFRGDDQLFVSTHIYGVMANNAPFFHLHKVPGGAIASSYLESFERVWDEAEPLPEGN